MIKLTIRPLAGRVVIEPAAEETMTKGGLIIPDNVQQKPQIGTIKAVGPGKKDEPVTVKIGDTVLYGKHSGTEISVEGKEYLIMRESDIFGVI